MNEFYLWLFILISQLTNKLSDFYKFLLISQFVFHVFILNAMEKMGIYFMYL
jgi:hypothetical protein